MATQHIVLGIDGSTGSAAAVAWCVKNAPLLDADVTAVYVLAPLVAIGPLPSEATVPPTFDEELRRELTTELETKWCAPLREAGVPFEARLLDGEPARTLIEVAERVDADLVIVGRRGRSSFAELLLGSVPHHLTHHCRRPVLVVSEPD